MRSDRLGAGICLTSANKPLLDEGESNRNTGIKRDQYVDEQGGRSSLIKPNALLPWLFFCWPLFLAHAQPVNPVPQGSPIPRVLPPAPPSVAPGGLIPPPNRPGANMPSQPVRVTSVTVEGATAYTPAELALPTPELVGPAVPLSQIDAAREAILQRYRADGYLLTTVSASHDAGGRLRFIVTEGRIAAVKLDG